MVDIDIAVVPYTRQQQRVVTRFVGGQQQTHYHLDWHSFTTWLTTAAAPSVVAYDASDTMVGVLLFAPPLAGISWLRLISLRDNVPGSVFSKMVSHALTRCSEQGITQISVLETERWLRPLLVANSFMMTDRVIHFRRGTGDPPALSYTVEIREAKRRDFDVIERVDHAAFAPLWWMNLKTFHDVMSYAKWFTVALMAGEIVGYQLSSSYGRTVHLTRLATLPQWQGQGIGSALVRELLHRFATTHAITVNTQESNEASQRLYKRLGFQRLNRDNPVWNFTLEH